MYHKTVSYFNRTFLNIPFIFKESTVHHKSHTNKPYHVLCLILSRLTSLTQSLAPIKIHPKDKKVAHLQLLLCNIPF